MSPQLFSTNAKNGDRVTDAAGSVWIYTNGLWTRAIPANEKIVEKRLVGMELVGMRSQFHTIRYTRWPGSLGMHLLTCEMPEGFKKGDIFRLGSIDIKPGLQEQLLNIIGSDLMIATTNKSFLDWNADAHWIIMDGGLFDLKRERWLKW